MGSCCFFSRLSHLVLQVGRVEKQTGEGWARMVVSCNHANGTRPLCCGIALAAERGRRTVHKERWRGGAGCGMRRLNSGEQQETTSTCPSSLLWATALALLKPTPSSRLLFSCSFEYHQLSPCCAYMLCLAYLQARKLTHLIHHVLDLPLSTHLLLQLVQVLLPGAVRVQLHHLACKWVKCMLRISHLPAGLELLVGCHGRR